MRTEEYFNYGELIKPFCSDEEALRIIRSLVELPKNFGKMNVADVEAKFEQTFGNGFKVGGEGNAGRTGADCKAENVCG